MAETPLPRDQFPVADRYVYLNHAGIGPMSVAAADATATAAAAFRDDGGLVYERYDEWMEQIRAAAAGVDGRAGDRRCLRQEHHRRHRAGRVGHRLEAGRPRHRAELRVPVERLSMDRACATAKCESTSSNRSVRRRELPLELFADALQQAPTRVRRGQLGAVRLRMAHRSRGARCARVASTTHCCVSTRSRAWVCCRRKFEDGASTWPVRTRTNGCSARTASASPPYRHEHVSSCGHNSRGGRRCPTARNGTTSSWSSTRPARRYEGGSPNVITTVGMGASIDLLLDAGVEAIWQHVDGLCQRLASGLTDLGAELRSVHDYARTAQPSCRSRCQPRVRRTGRRVGEPGHPRSEPAAALCAWPRTATTPWTRSTRRLAAIAKLA